MLKSGKWLNASQSPTWCELADCASSATFHERTRPKFIVMLYRLQCRSRHRPGCVLREGQARHGYEWSRTTSTRWTSASIPPGGRQLTESNGVTSWAQQRSSWSSRLWRETENCMWRPRWECRSHRNFAEIFGVVCIAYKFSRFGMIPTCSERTDKQADTRPQHLPR